MNKKYLKEVFNKRMAEAGELDKYKSKGQMPDTGVSSGGWKIKTRQGLPPGKEPKFSKRGEPMPSDEPHGGSERSPSGIWHDKKKAAGQHRAYAKGAERKGQEYIKPDPTMWPKNLKSWEKHMRSIGQDPTKMEPPPHDDQGNLLPQGDTGTTRDPSAGGMTHDPMTARPPEDYEPSDIAGTHGGADWASQGTKSGLAAKPKLKLKMGKK